MALLVPLMLTGTRAQLSRTCIWSYLRHEACRAVGVTCIWREPIMEPLHCLTSSCRLDLSLGAPSSGCRLSLVFVVVLIPANDQIAQAQPVQDCLVACAQMQHALAPL